MKTTKWIAITLALVPLGAGARPACPPGVEGLADPGTHVCLRVDADAKTYCTTADPGGRFYVEQDGSVGQCLPGSGRMYAYELDCPQAGRVVDRDRIDQALGGSWLDLRCPPFPCPYETTLTAGECDDFGGCPEPARPRPDVYADLYSTPTGAGVDFDVIPIDRYFAHSFDHLPANICAAKLKVHMRGSGSLTSTDSIGLQLVGYPNAPAAEFAISMNDLDGAAGDDGLWSPNEDRWFGLDLANLPGQPSSLLASLAATRHLDFILQDDTGVDCMRLNLTICPPAVRVEMTHGIADNFALPAEATTPSAWALQQANMCSRGRLDSYDPLGSDQCFVDTFAGLPSQVVAATLDVRLRANGGIPENDTFEMGVDGSTYEFGAHIGVGQGLPVLVSDWWVAGTTANIHLDFAALPSSTAGSPINLLSSLRNSVDLRVADDTGIDYARLSVWTCSPSIQAGNGSTLQVANVDSAPVAVSRIDFGRLLPFDAPVGELSSTAEVVSRVELPFVVTLIQNSGLSLLETGQVAVMGRAPEAIGILEDGDGDDFFAVFRLDQADLPGHLPGAVTIEATGSLPGAAGAPPQDLTAQVTLTLEP